MSKGKQGEILFKQIMESRGYAVQDVSGNENYYDKDIDFIITSPTSGLTKTFEVKWDYRINKTGNLYLELVNTHSKGCKGWYEFCQADYVAYGDAINGTFYVFSLLELKEKVKKMPQNIKQCGNDSIGNLVQLSTLKSIYQIL